MESLESQEAGFPPFPHSLEIPLGFPHSHGLDCGHVSKVNNKRKARKPDLRPFHRKGLVTDVPGPKCNERSSTLIPSMSFCKPYAHGFTHHAFFFIRAVAFVLRFPSGREPGGVQRQSL